MKLDPHLSITFMLSVTHLMFKCTRDWVDFSRFALNHIANEVDRMKFVHVDMSHYGCVLRSTHGLPCASELARHALGAYHFKSDHLY